VADFGFSHTLSATALLKVNSYGTVTHMAPEVLLAGLSGKAADAYSFGVLLWQMLTAARPWAGLRHDMVVHAVVVDKMVSGFCLWRCCC
jgi:serine/threonine protein kinase